MAKEENCNGNTINSVHIRVPDDGGSKNVLQFLAAFAHYRTLLTHLAQLEKSQDFLHFFLCLVFLQLYANEALFAYPGKANLF